MPDGNIGEEIFYEVNNKEVRLQDSRIFSLSKYTEEIQMAFDVVETGRRAVRDFYDHRG